MVGDFRGPFNNPLQAQKEYPEQEAAKNAELGQAMPARGAHFVSQRNEHTAGQQVESVYRTNYRISVRRLFSPSGK